MAQNSHDGAEGSRDGQQLQPHQDYFGLVQLCLHSGHRVGITGVLGEETAVSAQQRRAQQPGSPGPIPGIC